MNFDIDKKQMRAILSVLCLGLLLAAGIVFWKGDGRAEGDEGHDEKPAAAHAEEGGKDADKDAGKEAGHDDEAAIVMNATQIERAGITLAAAQSADIATQVQLPGEVKFNDDRTAHVVPQVAGVAQSVAASLGQSVRKGDVLATVSSPALAELRSEALAADKRLGLAQLTYERERKLWQDKITAEQDYLQARQALREAEIAAQAANAKLAAIGAGQDSKALNRFVLRAPFNGVVVEKHIAQGEAVKEDANVFLLSDLSTVWVDIVVAAKDLEVVRVGEQVTISTAGSDLTAKGKISYVGSLLGEETRAGTARVVIDNPQSAWRPGLFVNVGISRGKRQVPVTVAAEAIQTVEDKSVVFVRTAQGFKAQQVKTGSSDGRMVEITSGLKAGERYAATNSFVLKAEQGKGSADHDH